MILIAVIVVLFNIIWNSDREDKVISRDKIILPKDENAKREN